RDDTNNDAGHVENKPDPNIPSLIWPNYSLSTHRLASPTSQTDLNVCGNARNRSRAPSWPPPWHSGIPPRQSWESPSAGLAGPPAAPDLLPPAPGARLSAIGNPTRAHPGHPAPPWGRLPCSDPARPQLPPAPG